MTKRRSSDDFRRDMKARLLAEYAPYHLHPEFAEGWSAYEAGNINNPYENVPAQAWDRGAEACMRWMRLSLDPRTRKFMLDLRSRVAAGNGFATNMTDGARAKWLREADQLIGSPAPKPKKSALSATQRKRLDKATNAILDKLRDKPRQ